MMSNSVEIQSIRQRVEEMRLNRAKLIERAEAKSEELTAARQHLQALQEELTAMNKQSMGMKDAVDQMKQMFPEAFEDEQTILPEE